MDDTSQSTESGVPGFEEGSFQDASWEVIGEIDHQAEFEPLQVPVMNDQEFTVDPMFHDFGGFPEHKTSKRWHLPKEFAQKGEETEIRHQRELKELEERLQKDAEERESAAYERGKNEGMTEAVQQNNDRWTSIENSLKTVLSDLNKQTKEAIEDLSKSSVEFSLELSKKLLDTAVEINPEYIVEITHQALSLAGTALIKTVRVSPQDLEFIEVVGVRNLLKEFDGTWDFTSDSSIKAGCVVETTAGVIDYQLDQAWERVREQVVKVVRS